MPLSTLKSPCVLAAAMLALGAMSVPHMALAAVKADSCKPVKVVHKTKAHKAKAKKAKTIAVVHKARPKTKVIKVATAPCDCGKAVKVLKVVKVVQPVVEREVTVYRAEPRKWHAPYVDEVHTAHYATYKETSRHEETSRTTTRVVQRIYIRNDHYLTADSRPGRHRHTRWTRWID